jgi:hypothetical protein
MPERSPATARRFTPAAAVEGAWTAGPCTFAPTAAGYVTFALDPRNLGHSGGSPRQHFDMADRLRDLQAAISYTSTLADLVDPSGIGRSAPQRRHYRAGPGRL